MHGLRHIKQSVSQSNQYRYISIINFFFVSAYHLFVFMNTVSSSFTKNIFIPLISLAIKGPPLYLSIRSLVIVITSIYSIQVLSPVPSKMQQPSLVFARLVMFKIFLTIYLLCRKHMGFVVLCMPLLYHDAVMM